MARESYRDNWAEGALPQLDLRERTYELLSLVRAPNPEERRDLERTGLVFFQIEAQSLKQLGKENSNHFDWGNSLGWLRDDNSPPLMVVAIDPEQLFIPDSFAKSQAVQLAMIEERSLARQKDFPDAREILLPASALAQLDMAWFKETGGSEKLFKTSFAHALDQTADSDVAIVGRYDPRRKLSIVNWGDGSVYDDVGVLLAVVFLRE